MITVCHFELPIALLEKYGGWRDRRTVNEINMLMHLPFGGARVCFQEGENPDKVKYQVAIMNW